MMGLLKENQQEGIEGLVLGLDRGNLASPQCPDEIIFDAPPRASPVEAGVVGYRRRQT
jgi:hypothetical protein